MARCDLDYSCEDGIRCAVSEEEARHICEHVLEEENISRPCAVSMSVVSDLRIQEINLEWRNRDAATDVVSLECERPDDEDLVAGEPCELGDIVLAPEYIGRQAKGYGTTAADETRLLIVHAMLHLLGYDHIDDSEAEVMEAREDELLRMLKTDNTLTDVELTRHVGEDMP